MVSTDLQGFDGLHSCHKYHNVKTNNAVYGSHLGGIILVALTQVKTMALCHTLEVERKRHNYKIQTEERLAEVWRDKCKHQASEAKKKMALCLDASNC